MLIRLLNIASTTAFCPVRDHQSRNGLKHEFIVSNISSTFYVVSFRENPSRIGSGFGSVAENI